MDVAAWLSGLGLEQYAPAFRDNDVDGEVLPELTADDHGQPVGRSTSRLAGFELDQCEHFRASSASCDSC